jgi:uncharacterized protein (TIGR00251 family)
VAATTIRVKVKPNARSSELIEKPDGTWVARVKSPPIEGKANQELVGLVATRFQCPKSAVSVRHGSSGRMKLIRIEMD